MQIFVRGRSRCWPCWGRDLAGGVLWHCSHRRWDGGSVHLLWSHRRGGVLGFSHLCQSRSRGRGRGRSRGRGRGRGRSRGRSRSPGDHVANMIGDLDRRARLVKAIVAVKWLLSACFPRRRPLDAGAAVGAAEEPTAGAGVLFARLPPRLMTKTTPNPWCKLHVTPAPLRLLSHIQDPLRTTRRPHRAAPCAGLRLPHGS